MATKGNDLSDNFDKLSTAARPKKNKSSHKINAKWLILHPFPRSDSFWCSWSLQQLVDEGICQEYFQKLLSIIERDNGIVDFHMKLHEKSRGRLTVEVMHHTNHRNGPFDADVCISCDINNALSQAALVKENPTTRIWLDAQLREMLVVTPRNHIERLSEMTDEEMTEFWHDTQTILEEEGCRWRTMIINHGKYRNHSHLHMKINIEKEDWAQCIENKYKNKIEQLNTVLQSMNSGNRKIYFGDRTFNRWSKIHN